MRPSQVAVMESCSGCALKIATDHLDASMSMLGIPESTTDVGRGQVDVLSAQGGKSVPAILLPAWSQGWCRSGTLTKICRSAQRVWERRATGRCSGGMSAPQSIKCMSGKQQSIMSLRGTGLIKVHPAPSAAGPSLTPEDIQRAAKEERLGIQLARENCCRADWDH